MRRYAYHPAVLTALAQHGVQPLPSTAPQLVHDFVSDLYRFELRQLRARLVAGAIPRAGYADRVIAIRRRYPLLAMKPDRWAMELGPEV